MRALATWSGAITGLLLILVGSLIQAAVPLPSGGGVSIQPLPATLQVPALLLTALVCGHRAAMLAAVAYISVGLLQLPVFHAGGGSSYLLDPAFGYLAGFVPAAWLTGRLGRQNGMNNPLNLTAAAAVGLLVLQVCGVLNLILGGLAGRWDRSLGVLVMSYTVVPLVPQLVLCCAVGLLAWPLRHLLLLEDE